MTDRPIEELQAGNAFRDEMVKRSDYQDGPRPMWYGWVIMDAFLAGIDYARRIDGESQDGGERK